MATKTLETQIIELLRRSPATAEVLAILLETADVDAVERELESMFINSKVDVRRGGDSGALYRLVGDELLRRIKGAEVRYR